MSYSEEFIKYVGTVAGEAGGCSVNTWKAVAHCIKNRIGFAEWVNARDVSDILNTNDLQINLNNSSIDFKLINKIKNISHPLNNFCEVSQGYIPYRRSDLIKNFGEIEGNKIHTHTYYIY